MPSHSSYTHYSAGSMIDRIKGKIKKLLRPSLGQDPLDELNENDRTLIKQIKNVRLTYLSDRKCCSLIQTVRAIDEAQIPGSIIEAGCALGGSAILIARTKEQRREFRIYDVFGMIPSPTKEDTPDVHERYKIIIEGKSSGLGGDKYYGYEDDLYTKVLNNLHSFGIHGEEVNVELIKGLVQETLFPAPPIAMAHIDVDWYEPVMTCLERIYPSLSVSGSIVLDDYHDWGGCRKATDEFLRRVVGTFELDDSAGSMKITKTAGRHGDGANA